MNKTMIFALFFVLGAVLFGSVNGFAQEDKKQNPLFKSSLEWLKTPTEVENSTAATESEMKAYEEIIPAPQPYNDRKFKMLPIPGGMFLMGSPEDENGRDENESPQFEKKIEPFWMGEHEVSWREFELYGLLYLQTAHLRTPPADKARFSIVDAMADPTPPYDIGSISFNKSSAEGEYPASGMTYYCAQVYCKWLTATTGRYYRLPTEAEWEYACRAGTKTAFSFGENADKIDDYAWTASNCSAGYEKIMQKKPNAFGLYDMHGNVAEWTCDQFVKGAYEKYAEGEVEHGFFPVKGNFGQIARGGSCDDEPEDCRSAKRIISNKDWKSQDPQFPQSIWWVTDAPFVGFRVVRPLNPPKNEQEAKLYEPIPEVWEKYSDLNQR